MTQVPEPPDWLPAAEERPLATDDPQGTTVVVRRPGTAGWEYLAMHRAHEGPEYEGDWAWTPPAGSRLPGEPIDVCARRELLEEAGLVLELAPTACGTAEWVVYVAAAPPDAEVVLDAEHDRFEWVSCSLALDRCRPDLALLPLQAVVQQIRGAR